MSYCTRIDSFLEEQRMSRSYVPASILDGTYDAISDCGCMTTSKRTCVGCSSCSRCLTVRELMPEFEGDTPFTIECGSMIGSQLILRVDDTPHTFSPEPLSIDPKILDCGARAAQKIYRCDASTCSYLVSTIIEKTLGTSGPSQHHAKVLLSYRCGLNSKNIEEYYEPLEDIIISGEIHMYDILASMIVYLSALSKSNFVHGSFNVQSIGFVNRPVSYIYDEVRVTCPITVKICEYRKSSIDLMNVRVGPLFRGSSTHNIDINRVNLTVPSCSASAHNASARTGGACYPRDVTPVYRLNVPTIQTAQVSGLPMYPSLALYTMIASLLTYHTFSSELSMDKRLLRLVSSLFVENDMTILRERIALGEDNPLYNLRLRCDAVYAAMSILRQESNG